MSLISVLKNKFKKSDSTTTKYVKGMSKSRAAFASRLDLLKKKYKNFNSEYIEEVEELLIEADVGVNLTFSLIETVTEKAKKAKITNVEEINNLLIDEMFSSYLEAGDGLYSDIKFRENDPTVLLVVGVNGVGKTTSIAKIAKRYIDKGKKVLLVAADTFRAGATEQLSVWAERLGCNIVKGEANADPASVAYNGASFATKNNIDLMIVDTAGRLQNKTNLMDELSKISRVISKEIPDSPHETFLIIDATTGQNGVVQAKVFNEVTKLTGVVVTKLDGTSKGGIILPIHQELGVPIRFVGLGEGMDDLAEFDLKNYLYGLLIGESNE